jgi:two-component system sensor kinase FixL
LNNVIDGTQPPSDWSQQTLCALDISAATFHRFSGAVLWRSPAFDAMLGASAETVVALCDQLEGLEAALMALKPKATKPQATPLRIGTRQLEATLTPASGGLVVLKLEDRHAQAQARKRHLEDREQLLFTSRLLSIGEMATTLAHEINQPIGAAANLLRGTVMRLQRQADAEGHGPQSQQAQVLQALQRATDQVLFASKVIARIREYTHSHTPRRVPVDVVELVQSCSGLLDWETEREGVEVTLDLPEQPLWILADETMMQQLFVNLMRNAIDAMRGNTAGDRRMAIRVRAEGPQAEVTVCDCGSGISELAEQTLFVPFVSSKPTGTGIGLNICRSFVELHQGRLWFSRNPDAGISFHAALPMIDPNDSASA